MGTGVHLASMVVGFGVVVWVNRNQWFFGDEWAFLGTRGVLHGQDGLFVPHNEHWSTVPVLVYRGLYGLFGVRSYLPYVAVLAAVHVAAAHLLWRVMRRSGVEIGVATALGILFLFLGAGSENILWAFQIGFIGSVACGLGALLLVDRNGAFDWPPHGRDVAVWAVLVVGLMCSGIGVPMVAVAAIAVLLRRGFGRTGLARAGLVVSVPGAVYLGWLVLAGRDGIGERSFELSLVPAYIADGVTNAFGTTLGSSLAALVAIVALLAWMVWRRRLAVTSASPAFACATGVALLFVVLALGRAGFGIAQADASRYVYLAMALALPVVGLMLTDLAVRSRAAEVAVVALVGVLAVYNLLHLVEHADVEAARERRIRQTLLVAADMAVHDERFLNLAPDPTLTPDATTRVLHRMALDGKLPAGGFDRADRIVAASWLQLDFSDRPLPDAVPARLGPVIGASVIGASVTGASVAAAASASGLPAACVVLTPESPRPQAVIDLAGPTSVSVRSSAGGALRATLQDAGPPAATGERRSFTLEPDEVAYVDIVADVDQVVLAVPAAGTTEVCGI